MKTALVCIAKNEDFYIEEWIKYNLKLGFDDIFIYANDWNFSTSINNVHVIPLPGTKMQLAAYNTFKQTYNNMYNWAAFFDVDEFLYLKKHKNIQEFLSDYNDCNAIGINWAMFGNNGHVDVVSNNYSVLNRFTRRSNINYGPNTHIKTITRLPCNQFQDIHNVHGQWFNLNKEARCGAFNSPVDWSIAQLNHYFSKSNAELIIKCDRGKADVEDKRNYNDHECYLHLNDEEDTLARDFYEKL